MGFEIIKKILRFFNSIILTFITNIEGGIGRWLRYLYYRFRLKYSTGYFKSNAGFKILQCHNVSIGKNCSFNCGVLIAASNKIVIGNDVMIGPYTVIRDADHAHSDITKPINTQGHTSGEVIIGNDVWIGSHVVILKNVKIGDHSIIAAHSLVNRDIGEYEVWGGVPAKLIKKRK